MNDRWTDRLSDYLDGDLPAAERRALAAHLETCDACAEALDDLRDLVGRARGLRELDASIGVGSDLWPGIEARIRELPVSSVRPLPDRRGGWDRSRGGRSEHFLGLGRALPQLAAAAAAIVATAAAVLWISSDLERRQEVARVAFGSHRVAAVAASSTAGDVVGSEIQALKKELVAHREELDPETYRSLESSVASVETAVDETRRALDADPDDPYIQAHLQELRVRQLELLRHAVTLAGGAE
jgi:anti-sigma factor RsiW